MKVGSPPFSDCLFLSDVHLGAFGTKTDRQLEEELSLLIRYCRDHKIAIHILGDLFDYWMEYPKRDFHPDLGMQLLPLFREYNKEVYSIPYITGNHDHWTYGYLEELGFRLSKDYIETEIDGHKLLLCHGDGFADGSFGLKLPLMHRILKSDAFIKIYQQLLPPGPGLKVMKAFSSFNQRFPDRDPEPLNSWAENCLRNHDFNVIICGHDHIPRAETLSCGLYLNTGAYFEHKTLVLYKNREFRLVTWHADELNLKPIVDQH
jgi:UDP-2,3-diacylglucosamine pyrophosphatase LpxH